MDDRPTLDDADKRFLDALIEQIETEMAAVFDALRRHDEDERARDAQQEHDDETQRH